MWAALRVYSYDPCRLLLTFNASPNLVDATRAQSAAHWAAISGNDLALELLREAKADMSLKNSQVSLQPSPHFSSPLPSPLPPFSLSLPSPFFLPSPPLSPTLFPLPSPPLSHPFSSPSPHHSARFLPFIY